MKELPQEKTAGICRGFSLLIHAGIGLADAACLLSREETGAPAEVLSRLGQALDTGVPLSEAMESTGAFPGYTAGLIRVGEQTGRLEEALDALAEYYGQNVRLAAQIRRTLTWPCMILLLMLVVIGVLLVKVLPIFDSVYASLGSGLTGTAAILLELGRLLHGALPALFGILVLAAAAVVAACRTASLREAVTRWYLRRFGDRGIARRFGNARFAQGLAMCLGSGLPVEEALLLTRQMLDTGSGISRRIDDCRAAMDSGLGLAEALEQQQLLPPAACRMLALGLRGGNGDRVMAEAAQRMMEDARQSLEDAAARVEPAMVLVTSALVGVVLLSAMLPLMNIMASIG